MSIEILAPAGSAAQLHAALQSGADAVYMGASDFSARKHAENFAPDLMADAIKRSHRAGAKVYLALNTLLRSGEISRALELARTAYRAGADALIVQDLGLAALVKKHLPDLPLHASTQMSIHSPAGARMARELGFARVILARECTLDEIAEIAKEDIECEVFVHGALCMSVSGQCSLSALIGGRSGNRGDCAAPCRLPFCACKTPGCGKVRDEHHLSLRDLSAIDLLPELEATGVCAVKIEGRLKPPAYVAAVTDAVYRARAGEEYDRETIEKLFSRSGFTDGYLRGRRDSTMFGRRRFEDGHNTAQAVKSYKNAPLYREGGRSEIGRPITVSLTAKDGVLRAAAARGSARFSAEMPLQAAQNRPLGEDDLQDCFARTGDTPFVLQGFTAAVTGLWFAPKRELNALRRELYGGLLDILSGESPVLGSHSRADAGEQKRYARFETAEQLLCCRGQWADLDKVYLPVWNMPEPLPDGCPPIVAELPRVAFGRGEHQLAGQIAALTGRGTGEFLCHNLSQIYLVKRAGGVPLGGWGLNVLNGWAAEALYQMGVTSITPSVECARRELPLFPQKSELTVFGCGRLPAMALRACPLQNSGGCGECGGRGYLRDRTGASFPLLCRGDFSELYNAVPLWMADRPEWLAPADAVLLHFTDEDPGEVPEIISAYMAGQPSGRAFTRGLYARGIS